MRSIAQAVNEKYFENDDEDSSSSGFILFVPRSSPRTRLPSTLILDHCEIDSVGDEESFSSLCHEVHELDLAHNQISHWNEINKIITCLPKLSFLNLSYNMLGNVNASAPQSSYPSLKKLVLNHVGIQWNMLLPYLSLVPNLEELHLSFNQIEVSVDESSGEKHEVFPKIKVLHFDGNRIENRDHLQWLSDRFPSLTSLVLCDCPLWTLRWKSSAAREAQGYQMSGNSSSGSYSSSGGSSVASSCFGDGKSSPCCTPCSEEGRLKERQSSMSKEALFPHLRTVSLNNSMFDCWEEIGELRDWPNLAELRMQSCPLFRKLTDHERRQLTIARLPNLRRLNGGGDISAKEREEAERNFLRRFHDFEVKPARYQELLDVHGHVAPFAEVTLAPPKVANVLVRYGEQQWNEKSLSLYMTMKELKEKFSYTLGIPVPKLRLWHCVLNQPMLMTVPAKRLYSYNLKDGDEILVDEKL
nr:EOG090X05JJ [Scapholeberis mucronata]